MSILYLSKNYFENNIYIYNIYIYFSLFSHNFSHLIIDELVGCAYLKLVTNFPTQRSPQINIRFAPAIVSVSVAAAAAYVSVSVFVNVSVSVHP